jgi:hypothetical protein
MGGCNFLKFIMFFTNFSALEVPVGGVQACFNIINNGAFPLDLTCLEHLSVIVATQLQLNLQLKNN